MILEALVNYPHCLFLLKRISVRCKMLSVEHWSNPLLLWFDSMHTAVFFVKEISPPTALIQPCASSVHVFETYVCVCVHMTMGLIESISKSKLDESEKFGGSYISSLPMGFMIQFRSSGNPHFAIRQDSWYLGLQAKVLGISVIYGSSFLLIFVVHLTHHFHMSHPINRLKCSAMTSAEV